MFLCFAVAFAVGSSLFSICFIYFLLFLKYFFFKYFFSFLAYVGYFNIWIVLRTLAWSLGSLTCVRNQFLHVYVLGGGWGAGAEGNSVYSLFRRDFAFINYRYKSENFKKENVLFCFLFNLILFVVVVYMFYGRIFLFFFFFFFFCLVWFVFVLFWII